MRFTTLRARAIAACAALLIVFAACSSATEPLFAPGAPDELGLTLGGFGIGTSTLNVHGDTVILVRRANGRGDTSAVTVRSVPTSAQWQRFYAAANDVGVHNWRRQYNAEGVLDGAGWSLIVAAGGQRVESYGSNAYPDRLGNEHELEMTPEFAQFLDALSTLVGQRVGF